jgi:hypothetical protein
MDQVRGGGGGGGGAVGPGTDHDHDPLPDHHHHHYHQWRPHPLLAESLYLPEDAVPPLHDLPLGLVNRVVLGDFRRKETLEVCGTTTTSSDL